MPNKIVQKLTGLGFDPTVTLAKMPLAKLAQIVMGNLPCHVCAGRGRTKQKSPHGRRSLLRACPHCLGSRWEAIYSPLRHRAIHEWLDRFAAHGADWFEVGFMLGRERRNAVPGRTVAKV